MLPDCVADSVQVPAFNMVIVMPDTVHTVLVVEAMVTERSDVAVGETSKVVVDQGRSLMAVNDIICDA